MNRKIIDNIMKYKYLPLPKFQKKFVNSFTGDIVQLSKFQNLHLIICPSFVQNNNMSLYDKEASEKINNAFKLAEVVKEFIMYHNPQKYSDFTKIENRRDSNRATVDMGNGLFITFKGLNI